jgi:hypothetical protein
MVEGKEKLGKIFELAKYNPGVSQVEALKLADDKGLRLINNREADLIMQDSELREKFYDFWPLWTSTKVEMSGTHCKITENGLMVEKEIPAVDGWYEVDEFGLPFGKPSDSSNPDARYLWRKDVYLGLVARGYYGRFVYANYDDDDYLRLGVLAVKKK